ncbi:MAG: hypothetical protein EXS13_08015 [Planctomycetes bacterium]|nr:hypothetical protein [Planctomycetota bacterium]
MLLAVEDGRLREQLLATCNQGFARLTTGGQAVNGNCVLWAIGDAGEVVRIAIGADGALDALDALTVAFTPIGGRGIVAGRFDARKPGEQLAVFGYGGEALLLFADREGRWQQEAIFRDSERGHWLCAAEFDDRNATDELLVCGYSQRVVLIAQPPGAADRRATR